MDIYQMRLLAYGCTSALLVMGGLFIVDHVLKNRLALKKRMILYAGMSLILSGGSLFGIRLHRYREWSVIKSAADYHDVSMYHAAKRAAARREAEKKNVKDADRSTGVAPVLPSSDKQPSS